MQMDQEKKLKKFLTAFDSIGKLPRNIIKYGLHIFLVLFALGTAIVVYSRVALGYEPYFEFIAMSIVKTSFTILAEAIIGGLLIDYVFKSR
jgi:ABC-type Co2+ transport system permease subunit